METGQKTLRNSGSCRPSMTARQVPGTAHMWRLTHSAVRPLMCFMLKLSRMEVWTKARLGFVHNTMSTITAPTYAIPMETSYRRFVTSRNDARLAGGSVDLVVQTSPVLRPIIIGFLVVSATSSFLSLCAIPLANHDPVISDCGSLLHSKACVES